MKGKSPLVMIEQMVMVLVFAIAATLCVKMFVLSGELADKYDAVNQAVLVAQNVAEGYKMSGPGQEEERIFLDVAWNETEEENAAYYIEVSCTEENQWIWEAEVSVYTATGTELFCIPVATQKQTEVAENEEK